MKLRVVVWLIVGIVVVIGSLFLVLTGKSSRGKKVTIEDLKRQAARTETTVNALTARLAQAKAIPLPPEKSRYIAEIENNLTQARELVEKTKNSTGIREAEESLRKAHRLIRQTRRLLREATSPKPLRPSTGLTGT
ncbi:MAG: hypothetical protein K6T77_06505 [candidate division WOR-3 bacterium]|nr:hypothetical protein [candidate division WOR-3 bacterium]MCR4423581.1 hypothetical protein [candidate division WOR-3 bacterium]MDH7518920.1 hypothetical protein [bacterium]